MKILVTLILCLLLLLFPAETANAAADDTGSSELTAIKAGCEYLPIDISDPNYAGYPFKNPESISSTNGVLETTLDVKYAQNKIGNCEVNLRSYNGKLVGPTLRVKPGDTLRLKLTNSLPPEPMPEEDQFISKTSPEGCSYELETTAKNKPHNFNTTNFHAHGLHVNPGACSDNVIRVMKPRRVLDDPVPEYAVEIEIPENHPSGTFWYHAHLHGSTALQVSSGMAGALIIEGGIDEIPEIAAASDKVFVFQQIAYDQNGEIENYAEFGPSKWQATKRSITINGQVVPTITMRPGEIQHWRFIHAGVRESIDLELRDNHRQLPLYEIAVDGIPLGKLDAWSTAPIELEPGYRSDVLVQAKSLLPGQALQEYDLIDKPSSTQDSLLGGGETGHILAKVIVTGDPVAMALPRDSQLALVKQENAPQDILDAEITGPTQLVSFSINEGDPVTFTVNNQPFDPAQVRPLQLNKAEIWNLETDKTSIAPSHPFHIHVNPFQYDRQGPDKKTERIWRDTLLVVQGEPLEIRTRYTDFTGKFVLHCHILDHEDQGMMQVVQIIDEPHES